MEALAATARDAKEAIENDGEAGDDDESDRREREEAAAPPPIRLSAIAVARSMVSFAGLDEERETRLGWRWSIV